MPDTALEEQTQDAPQDNAAGQACATPAQPKSPEPNKPENASGACKAKTSRATRQPSDHLNSVSSAKDRTPRAEQLSGTTSDSAKTGQADEVDSKPTRLALPSELMFTGVAGHSTTPQSLGVTAEELAASGSSFKITGADFTAFHVDETLPSVGVRFAPNRTGALEASLLLDQQFEQQIVRLRGSAYEGDGKVTKEDGKLPGVSTLPNSDVSKSRQPADSLREAGRHVAEIGDRYNAIAPRAYRALDALNENSLQAVTTLHSRTTKWLTEEGIAEVSSAENPDHVPTAVNAGFMALKVILSAAKEYIPGGGISVAVGKLVVRTAIGSLLGKRTAHRAEEKVNNGVERLKMVGKKAKATDPALTGIIEQLEVLGEGLAFEIGQLDALASVQAQDFVTQLPDEISDVKSGAKSAPRYYKNAESILERYRDKEAQLLATVANVEVAAGSILPKVEAAFSALLDEYAVEQHHQIRSSGGDRRKLEVKVAGGFDLNQEPPVQLHHLAVEGLGNASATMIHHLAGKRLADLPLGCNATFTLNAMPYGTVIYEWDSDARKLYHRRLPVNEYNNNYFVKEFEKLGGYERIKSALLDMKVGTGASL